MDVKICTDPALVDSTVLRVRGRQREYFLWIDGRPRFLRVSREATRRAGAR